MIPSVVLVHSVEMIRDGGSLAAIFQAADGCEYWLFFEVRLKTDAAGSWETVGYEAPVVLDRLTGQSTPITRAEAESLLLQMRPFLGTDSDRRWHETMTALTAALQSTNDDGGHSP